MRGVAGAFETAVGMRIEDSGKPGGGWPVDVDRRAAHHGNDLALRGGVLPANSWAMGPHISSAGVAESRRTVNI